MQLKLVYIRYNLSIPQQRNKGKMTAESSEKDLSSTKHELLKIREMLEMAEKVSRPLNSAD